MVMDIGKQIKALRMVKGVTQEALAGELNVTSQAVSKWETGTTLPDIQLLPEIAVYFGSTIDELFKFSENTKLDRIENMLLIKQNLSTEEFERNRDYLIRMIGENPDNARACGLLAELYLKMSRALRENAVEYAKSALKAEPDCKRYHASLRESMGGLEGDYYMNRKYKLIEFYTDLMNSYPVGPRCRFFLLDQLLDDNRLAEAEAYFEKIKQVTPRNVQIHFYEGDIAHRHGKFDQALALWDKGVTDYDGDECLGYFARASRMEMLCRYEDALADYQKSFQLGHKPRFVDEPIACAQIYELLGEYDKAIEMRRLQIDVLKQEWNILSGEGIDQPMREIERLLQKKNNDLKL